MSSFERTHTCGALRAQNIGKEVVLSGWIHRLRDLGGVIFIDLRDRFGITQVVVDKKENQALYETSEKLRFECVLSIHGTVRERKDPNHEIPTGAIEVIPKKIELLSYAKPLPISVSDTTTEAHEEHRLKYRYLDMRKGPLLDNLIIRHKAMMATRNFLDHEGFTEVITPVLAKSTPEGARDYLVPSRVFPGHFYALPQSPQIFKQLLMVGGLDRYFQIATCFRDEDLRAERQPEFSQIDIEVSFHTPDTFLPIIEKLVQEIFQKAKGYTVEVPFQTMTYDDCMEYYGSDKPDLRFGMRFCRLDALAKESGFGVFQTILAQGGMVKGFTVSGGEDISRKTIDGYTTFIKQFRAAGLGWIKRREDGYTSSFGKAIEVEKGWQEALGLNVGDIAFIVAGIEKVVNQSLDHLRRKIAKERNMIDLEKVACLWVLDFPLFLWNDEENCMESAHHPFTAPHQDDMHLLEKEPLRTRSASYDLVINGYEVASGSQRIHDSALQDKIFQILGLSQEEILQKFGFFIEAMQYGTPPHIGIALGFDRMIMLLVQTESIKDVIAFPKTLKASDVMMQAPSSVTEQQLKELGIKLIE